MKRRTALKPGYDGGFELGSISVDDPYEPQKQTTVAVNIRDNVILHLYSRRQIDQVQARAGTRFMQLVILAEETTGLAVDPSREVVDGGGGREPLTEARVRALSDLADVHRQLGVVDYRLARRAIVDGIGLYSMADDRSGQREVAKRFRDVLTKLGIIFGFIKALY